MGKEFLGRVRLLNYTVLHYHYAGTHSHSFSLIIGNINDGSFQPVMQLDNFCPHLHPDFASGRIRVHPLKAPWAPGQGHRPAQLSAFVQLSVLWVCVQICSIPSISAVSLIPESRLDLGTFLSSRPKSMFSYTVICGNKA